MGKMDETFTMQSANLKCYVFYYNAHRLVQWYVTKDYIKKKLEDDITSHIFLHFLAHFSLKNLMI